MWYFQPYLSNFYFFIALWLVPHRMCLLYWLLIWKRCQFLSRIWKFGNDLFKVKRSRIRWVMLSLCWSIIFDFWILLTRSNRFKKFLSISTFSKRIFQFFLIFCCFNILSTNVFDAKCLGIRNIFLSANGLTKLKCWDFFLSVGFW